MTKWKEGKQKSYRTTLLLQTEILRLPGSLKPLPER